MEKVNAVSRCQHCNCKLVISGVEELQKEQSFMSKHPEIQAALGTSTMAGGKLDESFIVLDPSKQPKAGPSGISGLASLSRMQQPTQVFELVQLQAFQRVEAAVQLRRLYATQGESWQNDE